jgi:antitoxin (DNA-binding transcriptional repressor) of toxin-antitoxin stability system
MAVIHIPEEEAAKDLGNLLARVTRGDEIVIDGATTSVRLIPEGSPKGRTGAEMLAILNSLPGERAVIDDDFAADIEFAMNRMRSLPRNSPWD